MRYPSFAWLLPMLALAAGPAAAAVRDFPAAGFDQVRAGGVTDVVVHVGSGFAVHADGDPAVVDALTVTVRDGALVIGTRPGIHNLRGRAQVTVSLPRLVGVSLSGTGGMTVDRTHAPSFAARMAGTGNLALGDVAVGRLTLVASGTGHATAVGRADRIEAELSGTGKLDLARLQARGGRIVASGVGTVNALVDGPVEIVASGIGRVTVAGHPVCTVHRSGLAKIDCA